MATKNKRPMHQIKLRKRGDDGEKQKRDLDCFLNQPNINMVIPWLYDIKNTMKSRDNSNEGEDGKEDQDEMEKSLQCFENQPNINMAIPWIYSIYKSVKSGGGGGGEGSDLEWVDES